MDVKFLHAIIRFRSKQCRLDVHAIRTDFGSRISEESTVRAVRDAKSISQRQCFVHYALIPPSAAETGLIEFTDLSTESKIREIMLCYVGRVERTIC